MKRRTLITAATGLAGSLALPSGWAQSGAYPNRPIKVIVPHGGAALPALIARIAAFANLPFLNPRPASEQEVFETLEGLYYDVALSTHAIPFAALRRIAPISQILFGSDWPFTPEFAVERNLSLLGQLDLSESDARALAHENAERLFPRLAKMRH